MASKSLLSLFHLPLDFQLGLSVIDIQLISLVFIYLISTAEIWAYGGRRIWHDAWKDLAHTIQLTAALIIHFPLRLYSCNIALVHFAMTYFYSCQSIPSRAHLSACQLLDPCRNPAQRYAAVWNLSLSHQRLGEGTLHQVSHAWSSPHSSLSI